MNRHLFTIALIALTTLAPAPPAYAVSSNRMAACYDIDKEDVRLNCYDKLALSAMGPSGNASADQMLQMQEGQQARVLSGLAGCTVTFPYYIGVESKKSNIPEAAIWNVKCSDGKELALALAKNGTLQAKPITCEHFKTALGYACFHRPPKASLH